jgi:2,3-diaminopropionate biosynthesis protein SbnA
VESTNAQVSRSAAFPRLAQGRFVNDGVLSIIGNTPLIKLSKLFQGAKFNLYAKLESLNPGGSIKDRPAVSIIKHAFDSGQIKPGSVVIESSSGNMGVGLAQACAYLGLRLICVVDPKTTKQNQKLIRAYGAEVDVVTEPDPETHEYLQARIKRVNQLLSEIKNSFWPNQYANKFNPEAHHKTMEEIVYELQGKVDYLFCATSTCGTLRGCVEYIQRRGLRTKVIAVDAVGSIIFGGKRSKRLIPGHGAAVLPPLCEADLADRFILVSDLDCVIGCRRLVRSEALLAGGSSGAVVSAINHLKGGIPRGANCVAIMADRGSRYLETIYSDEWVTQHFGDVSANWETEQEEQEKWLAATS